MSRIGKSPIAIPSGVTVSVAQRKVTVKGPKGTLHLDLMNGIDVEVNGSELLIVLSGEEKDMGKFHGLHRALIQNMVVGTHKGYERKLEMIGVGYRATVQGHYLDLQIGFSHPTKLVIPEGLQVKVEKNNIIIISGIDKQLLGQFAASVRAIRPPEPYQGKGIRYEGEYVRKKAGKAASTSKK